MKISFRLPALLVSALLGLAGTSAVQAQVVTTGIIQNVEAEKGGLTVLSDQTHQPIMYHDLDKTAIQQAQGAMGTMKDLQVGMRVSVTYVERNGLQYVSKVQFMDAMAATDPKAAAAATVANSVPATAGTTAVPATVVPGTVVSPAVVGPAGQTDGLKPRANPNGGGMPDPVPAVNNSPVRNRPGGNQQSP